MDNHLYSLLKCIEIGLQIQSLDSITSFKYVYGYQLLFWISIYSEINCYRKVFNLEGYIKIKWNENKENIMILSMYYVDHDT